MDTDRRRNHHKKINQDDPPEMKSSTEVADKPVLEPVHIFIQYTRLPDYLGYVCPTCGRRFTLCQHKDAHLHLGRDSRRRCDRCYALFMTVGIKDAWEALFATLDERGLPSDTLAFRAACDKARGLIADSTQDSPEAKRREAP